MKLLTIFIFSWGLLYDLFNCGFRGQGLFFPSGLMVCLGIKGQGWGHSLPFTKYHILWVIQPCLHGQPKLVFLNPFQIKNPKVHPSTEEAYHPKLSNSSHPLLALTSFVEHWLKHQTFVVGTVPARCSFLLICFVGCLSFQNLEIYLWWLNKFSSLCIYIVELCKILILRTMADSENWLIGSFEEKK